MTAPPGLAPTLNPPTSATAPAQTPEGFSVPEITLTGWRRRITEFCEAHGVARSERQIKNMAAKIARRAERMHTFDPDDLIRKVINYADPTGEDAVRNVMRGSAS